MSGDYHGRNFQRPVKFDFLYLPIQCLFVFLIQGQQRKDMTGSKERRNTSRDMCEISPILTQGYHRNDMTDSKESKKQTRICERSP